MQCPRCKTAALSLRTFGQIMVDVCPCCKGIWLDRGELEKFMAASRQPLKYNEEAAERFIALRTRGQMAGMSNFWSPLNKLRI